MNYFRNLAQQLSESWQKMSPGRRLGFLVMAGVALAAIVGVYFWASQPDYRVLYAGLAVEDAGAITSKLQAQGINYRLAAGGTTIMVPAEQVQQARIDLMADGLPAKGGKGFEIFDQSPLGMTPFTQHVNYLRALQSELARTIMQIDPIVFARVHIVRPDPSPFIREQKPTTASVFLRLKAGVTLNRNVAAGIVSLVSRSVEGLAKENVTLVDANGKLLSEERNPETGPIGSQMEYRRELENYLSARAETMLAQVVGPGRALVRVTADIDFKRHRKTEETYNPDGRVQKKEIIKTVKSQTPAAGPRGPAGTASNLGKGVPAVAAGPGPSNSEESIETDYAISKITQEFEDKMGNIERLTIAALVDLSPADKEKAETTLTLADAQDIIKQAVGYKKDRDDIKVTNVKLTGAPSVGPTDDEWEKVQTWQNIVSLVRNASLGIAALAALLLGWMLLRRLKPRPAAGAPAAPAPAEKNPVLEKLSSTAQQDPQVVARILANWLDQADRPRRAAA